MSSPPKGPVARLRRGLGTVARRGLRFVERLLHPWRYRVATKRLQNLPRPESVVVICYGNICRSPYLEAVLRKALPDTVISSAGFVGAGRGVPPHSLTLSGSRGIELSAHRSRLITSDILADGDLFIVMDANQARVLQSGFRVPADRILVAADIDPEAGNGRTIHDPWGQSLEVFETSFNRLDGIGERLATLISQTR